MTYMRNSPVVRSFKMALVKMFWELAKAQEQSRDLSPATVHLTLSVIDRCVAPLAESVNSLAAMVSQMTERMERIETAVGVVPEVELTVNPAGLTTRQRNLLSRLPLAPKYVAPELVGASHEMGILGALKAAGYANHCTFGWWRTAAGEYALTQP